MKITLILTILWGNAQIETVTKDFADEAACENAATHVYNKVMAASQQLTEPPQIVWDCEEK
jgi:hypothetical protein